MGVVTWRSLTLRLAVPVRVLTVVSLPGCLSLRQGGSLCCWRNVEILQRIQFLLFLLVCARFVCTCLCVCVLKKRKV